MAFILATVMYKYCLLLLHLQRDLDDLVNVWSDHRIRPSHNTVVPAGRPITLFFFPELYGAEDELCPVSADDVAALVDECTFADNIVCDSDLFDLCHIIMDERNLQMPCTCNEGVTLYKLLRQTVHDLL